MQHTEVTTASESRTGRRAPRTALGLMLILLLLAAACGDNKTAAEEPTPPAAPTSTPTDEQPADEPADDESSDDEDEPGPERPVVTGTVEEWATLVVALRLDEAERLLANFVENTIDSSPETFAADMLNLCTGEAAIRDETDGQLPATYGSDEFIADVYTPWLEARAAVRPELAIRCEIIEERQADLSFESPPESGDAYIAAVDAELMACFPLQEAISFITGEILNCDGNADCPDCPSGPSGDPAPETDISVCDGPTDGPIGGQIALPAGPCELAWFPIPFSIDTPEDLVATSGSGFLWLETPGSNFLVEIHAPAALADPSALGAYELDGTIPPPASLDDWFDQLPLEVLEQEEVEYPGGIAIRRLIRADQEAMIVTIGEEALALWPGGFIDVVLAGFEGGESRYVWELRTDDGSLVTIQGLYEDPFGSVFTGLPEWVETVILANLSFG